MPEAREPKLYTDEQLTQSRPDAAKVDNIAISVTTGTVPSGGTDAVVRLDIGAHQFEMDTRDYNDFERGATNTSYFKRAMTLGELRRAHIRLSHDNSGKKPGWYVENAVLQVKFRDSNYMVLYKRWGNIGWLSRVDPPYYTTEVELPVGKEQP